MSAKGQSKQRVVWVGSCHASRQVTVRCSMQDDLRLADGPSLRLEEVRPLPLPVPVPVRLCRWIGAKGDRFAETVW